MELRFSSVLLSTVVLIYGCDGSRVIAPKDAGAQGNTTVDSRCKIQSPDNLIPNGGFNSASGWTPIVPDGTTWDATTDRYDCATSGALILGKMGANSDCIKVTPLTTYHFGLSYIGPRDLADPICGFSWFHANDCAYDSYFDGTGIAVGTKTVDWQVTTADVFAPEGARGLVVKCYDFGSPNTEDGKGTRIDLMYMNAVSKKF